MTESAVVVDGVSKRFRLYSERNQTLKAAILRAGRAKYQEFWALRDVSFEIEKGQTYGIVGENGSGKSTLLKCLARILRPDEGTVRTTGKVAALLELGSGFHQELSGRENVYLNGSILGLTKRDIKARFDEIVSFAGVERFIDQPVKNYSSGMYVRLGFSVATHLDPDVLLVDEVLAVGDAAFQRRCFEKFADFRNAGKTVVMVSHASESMRTMCDKAAWINEGRLEVVGPAAEVVDRYVDHFHTDREEVAGATTRWGSGEARLASVELLGPDGEPTHLVHTGEAVTLRMSWQADQPVAKPVFGLALETLEGTWLWAHHTRDAGFVPDELPASGSVDLHVPRLMLQPGTYDVSASIVDYTTTHVYDYLRRGLRFDVEHGDPRESGGYVALGGTWRSEAFPS